MSEFNPKLKTKVIADAAEASEVVVDTRVAEKIPTPFKITSPERFANAQRRAREHRNPESPLLQFAGEGYYKDYAGPLTNEHEWDLWRALGALLHTRPYFRLGFVSYDRLKGEGVFVDGTQRYRIPINILKAAIETRIQELGLAKHLLWEYLAECHTVAEDTAFYATSLYERIKRFRDGALDGGAQDTATESL